MKKFPIHCAVMDNLRLILLDTLVTYSIWMSEDQIRSHI